MTIAVPKGLARDLALCGWVDGGDNHWSKEGVGYIRRTPGRDSWRAQAWDMYRTWHYPTIQLCVERLEFNVRADKALDKMMAVFR